MARLPAVEAVALELGTERVASSAPFSAAGAAATLSFPLSAAASARDEVDLLLGVRSLASSFLALLSNQRFGDHQLERPHVRLAIVGLWVDPHERSHPPLVAVKLGRQARLFRGEVGGGGRHKIEQTTEHPLALLVLEGERTQVDLVLGERLVYGRLVHADLEVGPLFELLLRETRLRPDLWRPGGVYDLDQPRPVGEDARALADVLRHKSVRLGRAGGTQDGFELRTDVFRHGSRFRRVFTCGAFVLAPQFRLGDHSSARAVVADLTLPRQVRRREQREPAVLRHLRSNGFEC